MIAAWSYVLFGVSGRRACSPRHWSSTATSGSEPIGPAGASTAVEEIRAPTERLLDALEEARRSFKTGIQLAFLRKTRGRRIVYHGPVLVDLWKGRQIVFNLARQTWPTEGDNKKAVELLARKP